MRNKTAENHFDKTQCRQKGISLIITFFIMIIILSVVLSISALLYSEVKIIRNMGNSVVSFYAADSGVEKLFYYDRQVLPLSGDGVNNVQRGLCSMLDAAHNTCNNAKNPSYDSSIYCDAVVMGQVGSSDSEKGCDYDVCDDCTISFNTNLDNGSSYNLTAQVYPLSGVSNFDIKSKGIFGGTQSAQREVEVFGTSTSSATQSAHLNIAQACFSPRSSPSGTVIDICAHVEPSDEVIVSFIANIYDYWSENFVGPATLKANSSAMCTTQGYEYSGSWTTYNIGDYFVDLTAKDGLGIITQKYKIEECKF